MFDELLALSYYWNLTTWAIESVAAQKLLIPLFKSYITIRRLPQDLIVMIPLSVGKASKASRILAMRASLSSGSYGIVQEEAELFAKYEKYSPLSTAKDDDIDSGAHGLLVWAQEGERVKGRGTVNVLGAVMGDVGERVASADLSCRIP